MICKLFAGAYRKFYVIHLEQNCVLDVKMPKKEDESNEAVEVPIQISLPMDWVIGYAIQIL